MFYLNRKAFGEESWGGWRDVCFVLILITFYLLFFAPLLSYLFFRLGNATVAFFSSCASRLAGHGGDHSFFGLSVFWFLFWLAKRLISYFPLPDTTIHLASQHISDTEHSIGGPRLAGWIYWVGFPGWDGGRAEGLDRKIVHHGLMGYDRIPPTYPLPLAECLLLFFLFLSFAIYYLFPVSFYPPPFREDILSCRCALRERRYSHDLATEPGRMQPGMGASKAKKSRREEEEEQEEQEARRDEGTKTKKDRRAGVVDG